MENSTLKFKNIVMFTIITCIGFPILFEIRNYIVGGGFTFSSHPSVLIINFFSFYKIIFAVEWPNIPRIPGIIIFASFIVALLSVFSKY